MMGDSRISVQIGELCLLAEVSVTAGLPAADAELAEALQRAGVSEGLDAVQQQAIAQRLASPDYRAERLVIARGDAGEPARDGELELMFDAEQASGQRRPDGSLDYRERSTSQNATEGQLIARYQPAKAGRDGLTVTGQPIVQAAAVERLPALGTGVDYDRATGRITATRPGVITWVEDQTLDVTDFYENRGDVDYATGNLHVAGSVHVMGDVCEGFSVTATGDVFVDGHVSGAVIESEANVTIGGGVLGQATATVRARGAIACRHIIGGKLTSESAIHVQDQSVNGDLMAPDIRFEHGRGKIVGGKACAENTILVVEAGAPAAVPTMLSAADQTADRARIRKLRRDTDSSSRRRSKALRGGEPAGGKALRSQARKSPRLQSMLREQARRQKELLESARIIVSGRVHPNVKIRLGQHTMEVLDSMHATCFRFDHASNSISAEDYQT